MKQHIVETLQKYIDSQTKKVKGISVIVTTKDKTIFEYASGIVDGEKTPNDVSRMFSIGSNTKLLTAIAIFQLVDKKLLDIDEDIKTYIPEFEVQSLEEYDKITVRQILMEMRLSEYLTY